MTKQVTIATDSGGRQRTCMDDLPQATCAVKLAVAASTWLRDEEASNPRAAHYNTTYA